MGHVDGAHQAEDQREPGCNDEHQSGKGDPVEEGDEELTGFIDRSAEGVPVAKNSTQQTTNTTGIPTAMAGSRRLQVASIQFPLTVRPGPPRRSPRPQYGPWRRGPVP